MPFYVSPEQVMSDKAKFARSGIAKGRALVALQYEGGIIIASENSSKLLHKISEVYDRIAFAGVGKHNEFDQLRQFGVRQADVKGYQYSREDVDARTLATLYGQILGQIFTHELKPYEVEILVAEVGRDPSGDELYHILYDGIVIDQQHFVALGGESEAIMERLTSGFEEGMSLERAMGVALNALAGPDRTLAAKELEVAVLDRGNGRRTFRRIEGAELDRLVQAGGQGSAAAAGGSESTSS